MNLDKLKRMLSLAEQGICIYCSFCEPVHSVVSKENFVLKSGYTEHWHNGKTEEKNNKEMVMYKMHKVFQRM